MQITSIGSEIEFSITQERELKSFFFTLNNGNLYNILLTRKRARDRFYRETDRIAEYRSPVISADSYYRFAKYYFFISHYSQSYHVRGSYDYRAGSIHTHLKMSGYDEEALNSLIVLHPLMGRYSTKTSFVKFRDSVLEDGGHSEVYWEKELPIDSKSFWITYNTGTSCVEIRLNENIPVWYILVKSVHDGIITDSNEFYEMWEHPAYCLDIIDNRVKSCRDGIKYMKFKSPIQREMYIDLLTYIEFYTGKLKNKEPVSIKTFSKYLLNYSPLKEKFKRILEIYEEETDKITYLNGVWEER